MYDRSMKFITTPSTFKNCRIRDPTSVSLTSLHLLHLSGRSALQKTHLVNNIDFSLVFLLTPEEDSRVAFHSET